MERSLHLLCLLLDYTNEQVELLVPASAGPLGLPEGPPPPHSNSNPSVLKGVTGKEKGLDEYSNLFVYFINHMSEKVITVEVAVSLTLLGLLHVVAGYL